jgi:alkylated DNA repair dioxygenase AlkB
MEYNIENNWLDEKSMTFFKSLSFNGYVLAGHSVTNIIQKVPLHGDLDFWVMKKDNYINILLNDFYMYDDYNIYPSMIEMISNDGLPKINLIFAYLKPDEIINRFDFDYCRCYYTPETGVVARSDCLECIKTKIIRHSNYTTTKRILKAVHNNYLFSNDFWGVFSDLLNCNKKPISSNHQPLDIKEEDLDLNKFKKEKANIMITGINDKKRTLDEIFNQYNAIVNKDIELPILLTIKRDTINFYNLLKYYTENIILNNPLSDVHYMSLHIGQKFIQLETTEPMVNFKTRNVCSEVKKEINDSKKQNILKLEEEEEEEEEEEPIKQHSIKKVIKTLRPKSKSPSRSPSPQLIKSQDDNYLTAKHHFGEIEKYYLSAKEHFEKLQEINPFETELYNQKQTKIEKKIEKIDENIFKNTDENILMQSFIIKKINSLDRTFRTIQLNESGTAYITLEYLPDNLLEQSIKNYDDMYVLHPENKFKIIMYSTEIETHRYQQSYLHTPEIDEKHISKHSYMYSGFDASKNNTDLPEIFKPYYEFMKAKDDKYNQAIVNWYDDNNDYIAEHADCTRKMLPNGKISIITFNKNVYESRVLKVIPKNGTNSLFDQLLINLHYGLILTMHGTCQDEFKHGIPVETEKRDSRISLSIRQMVVE